ncbi:MAG: amino acid adenylation domain-containing protein [Opitutae bacterium]|nr:amino acid adenylation domain-containing protein [Opitutae bacterium]
MTNEQATLRRQNLSSSQQALLERRLQSARQTARSADLGRAAIPPRPPGARIPLSFAQERLWFLDRLNPGQAIYNVYQAARLRGPLDSPALERSLNDLVQRHEVFRTTFAVDEGEPVQTVLPAGPVAPATADLSGISEAARPGELLRLLRREAARPFALTDDRLLRVLLVRLGPTEHALLLTMHHIVSDGWSLGIVFRELAERYAAHAAGDAAAPAPLPVQFADYAVWERAGGRSADTEKSLAYWRAQLAGVPALELPADWPRVPAPSTHGATHTILLPATVVQAAKALSQRAGVTPFMTLLAAFQTLLFRYSGQPDFALGSCVAGRPQLDLEKLVGFFVNTVVFRADLAGDPTFADLLARTRETTLGAFAHQELPFGKLVEELHPDRRPGRNPLFQVMFVLQSAAAALPALAGLEIQPLEFDNGTAKFDLTLSLTESAAGLHATAEYSTDLFAHDTVVRMLGHFRTLLTGAAAEPQQKISLLPLLTASERHQIVGLWRGERTDYPRDATIPGLFAEKAAAIPDAVALVHRDGQLSYRQLDARANRIARHLQRLGVKPGALVGVCLERSPDLIAALLGILKAGAAYVAFDPTFPPARLAFMLRDSQVAAVVSEENFRPALSLALESPPAVAAPPLVWLDKLAAELAAEDAAAPPPAATAESLAYVCYTSGTTGQPKGVCVSHRGVVRLVIDTDYAHFGPDETFLQFAPVSFDASTLEIWGALLNGARLVIHPPGMPSLAEFGRFIREHQVTTLWLTAGLFHHMVDHQLEDLRGVRQLLAGGDVLSADHIRRVLEQLPGTTLINGYGPTENTTFTCCHRFHAAPAERSAVPIGRPVANTEVFILDAALQPVPAGVPGELYAGGDGLADGYLRQPELTREKFVPHPFSAQPRARLYRTGDRARWRADGSIEFLGRIDQQVKIRGFRVELEEIETVLARHPAVAQAVVVAHPAGTGDKKLIAYAVCRTPAPDPAALRMHLQEFLPDHMVPAAVVRLERLPLTANGKIDRAALPVPGDTGAGAGPEFCAPRNPTETRLAALWARVLGVHRVSVHDNFFELGGHSLAGGRLFAHIEAEFGRKLPLASLFQAPTVAQLARLIAQSESAAADCSSLVALQQKGARPPVFFVHGAGGGNLWTYTNLVPHLGPDQPIYALESRAMRGGAEFARLDEMAASYVREIRTVQPHGPYLLGGYCFGGNVAYEMARQLADAGELVALLALLDSAPVDESYRRIPWWRPVFLFRFTVNTVYWLQDFLHQTPVERRRFVRRKFRTLWRRLTRSLAHRSRPPSAEDFDLDEVIDVALFPEIEVQLWKTHLRALWTHQSGRYAGRVTLFRTRGQPFLCSFDPQFGWGALAAGGVDVVNVPGAHENIFMEPHVRVLSARLRRCLDAAQAGATSPAADYFSP